MIGCTAPIQLAGMPGVGTVELAALVASAGGLGMISATHISPIYLSETLDELKRGTDGALGVNFLIPYLNPECIEVAASKSRVVEFFYGDPDPALVEAVHKEGALASWQVGSAAEARAAARAGCDFIVAQGTQAGGHVRGDVELSKLLTQILGPVEVPVLAAGGISTGKDLAGVLKAGAAGARIGTRFVASIESGAHPKYVEAVINAKEGDTSLTETFSVGWPNAHHRVLRSCIDEVNAFEGEVVGERELGGEKKPVLKRSIALPTKTTTGKIGAMALYAGESVGEVRSVEGAEEIVREIVEEAASILASAV